MKKRTAALLIFAALAAAILWYTKPVTMAKTLDTKNLISVEATLLTPQYIQQANGTIIQQERTDLSAQANDPAFAALLHAMEEIPSHASLAGLLFPNHQLYDQRGTLSISFRTQRDVTTLLLLYNSGYFYWENRYGCLSATERAYPVSEDTFAALAALVKEYGTNSGTA